MDVSNDYNLSSGQRNTLKQLKAVLMFIAIFHLLFGFGLMFSIDFQKFSIAKYIFVKNHFGRCLSYAITNVQGEKMVLLSDDSNARRELLYSHPISSPLDFWVS